MNLAATHFPGYNEINNRGLPDTTFGDLAYHFLIDCGGHIFEGRAGGDGVTFEETGQSLAEPFRSYWEANGGLAIFGFPVSPVRPEASPDDGKTYQVQYFERARFELHPELAGTPYYISLGRLGLASAGKSRQANPAPYAPFPPPGSSDYYFQETGHALRGSFLKYWIAKGGLAIFGLPLSEEFQEKNAQGQLFTVQYFERARFEFHPENPAEYWVLLGRLGADAYQTSSL